MHFPSTLYYEPSVNDYISRTQMLKHIVDDYQPDLFMVCELESAKGADIILNDILNFDGDSYNRANFSYNQSTTETNLQQLVFYNQQKLELVYQDIILTDVRDINHYSFKLNSSEKDVFLEVFVTHLKSSQGSAEENQRLQMVQQLTTYLESIPTSHYVIFGGDFNLYDSYEPAYQELLDTSNAFPLNDPIDRPGNWHNNSSYQDIHTQSPLTSSYQFDSPYYDWEGTTGGMDDRFDFLLVSENLLSNSDLYYVSDTYKAYGNNGNCFNGQINNTSCSGEDYSQELRDNLVNMSDHIPVVMTLETPITLSNSETTLVGLLKFKSSNVSDNHILLWASEELKGKDIVIYNQLGQEVKNISIESNEINLNINNLSQGIYWMTIADSNLSFGSLKFIKS